MFEKEKKELTDEFDLNIRRAYMKLKQLVAEESEDNQKLSAKFQELTKKEQELTEKVNESVVSERPAGKKR